MILIRYNGDILNLDHASYICHNGHVDVVGDVDRIYALIQGEREAVTEALIRGDKVLDLRNKDTPSRQDLLARWSCMLDTLAKAAGHTYYGADMYHSLFEELYNMAAAIGGNKEIKNG